MKILFMGSPPIAAAVLKSLLSTDEHEVCAVFTREKKPVGRKKVMTATAVGQLAQQEGLTLYEPKMLKDGSYTNIVKQLAPDIIVVVAYGRILPKEILDIPKYGAVNLHVSLLPKYRGAAPIQHAIINGEVTTGVSIMQMDEGLDTGDVISQAEFTIERQDTAGDVFQKTELHGIPLLLKTLSEIKSGRATFTPQNHEIATLAPPLKKSDAVCNFSQDATTIHNKARGVYPYMQASVLINGTKCGLCSTMVKQLTGKPAEVLSTSPLIIACADGALVINTIQPEGKKPMDGAAFVAGRRLRVGDLV